MEYWISYSSRFTIKHKHSLVRACTLLLYIQFRQLEWYYTTIIKRWKKRITALQRPNWSVLIIPKCVWKLRWHTLQFGFFHSLPQFANERTSIDDRYDRKRTIYTGDDRTAENWHDRRNAYGCDVKDTVLYGIDTIIMEIGIVWLNKYSTWRQINEQSLRTTLVSSDGWNNRDQGVFNIVYFL